MATQIVLPNVDVKRPFQRVQNLAGKYLRLPIEQVPTSNTYKISNYQRFSFSGSLSSLLSSGGSVSITIPQYSGSGSTFAAYLRLAITNRTGSSCQLVPLPLCIDSITLQNGSGNQIQQWTGESLYMLQMVSHDSDSWFKLGRLLWADPQDSSDGDLLQNNESKEYYLPLTGSIFDATSIPLYAIAKNLQLVVNFRPSSTTVISGSAPTLTDLTLDIKMSNDRPSDLAAQRKMYADMPHCFFYPNPRVQSFNQTLSASNTYSFQLTGFNNCDCVWMAFFIRPTSPTLNNLFPQGFIDSFQILDGNGLPISRSSVTNGNFSRYQQSSAWSLGRSSYWLRYYQRLFANSDHGLITFLSNGQKDGSYQFTGNEKVNIFIGAPGVSEVVTVTASGVLTGGNYIIGWSDETETCFTSTLAYNTTPAQIAAAIQALPNFSGTITVSAAFSASTRIPH
jgi:hypothetical protein